LILFDFHGHLARLRELASDTFERQLNARPAAAMESAFISPFTNPKDRAGLSHIVTTCYQLKPRNS
jgi:hypothetical protein